MVGMVHQTEQVQHGWATFAPEEFVGQRPGRSARPILSAITEINDLLLSPESQHDLFVSIAQVCARALDYPFVSVLLFDDDLQHIQVAGINDPDINLLMVRRGSDVVYRPVFPLSVLRDLPWMKAVRDGMIVVTTRPQELITPFATAVSARTLVRRLGIVQGIVIPLIVRGKMVGALKVGSRRAEYEPGERNDLLSLAHHTALAQELWRLYDRAEGRTAILKRLHTLSQTITGILDLDMLYQEIVKAAGRLAPIDFCTVNILTPDRKGYRNHAAWGEGLRSEVLGGIRSIDIFPREMIRRALAGKPMLVADLSKYPAARKRLSHRNAGAVAVFTFRSEGRPIGFITVGRDEPGEWESETVEMLNELAEYVAVAFTNARRYAEATRQAAVQTALAESARMIARAETRSVIQAIVEAGSRLFMDSRFALLLPDAAGDLICVAAHGPGTEDVLGFWVHKGEGLAGIVFESGKPAMTEDIQAEASSARKDIDERAHFHSYMAVPMTDEIGTIGVLVAGHHERGLYTESDLTLLNTLADHATIAMQNERLLTEARRTATEQETLAESARLIARAETETVLQTIVQAGNALVLGSQFAALLPDNDGNLVCVAAFGPQTDRIIGYKIKKGQGLLGRVFMHGEPMLVEDIQTAPGSAYGQAEVKAGFRSWMAVPMMSEQGSIGVLAATHAQPGLYTAAHLNLVSTLADHATIALENQRLLQDANRQATEQAALAESANAIARLDVETVLNTIVSRASEIVQLSRCSVFLYEEETGVLKWAAGVDSPPELQAEAFPATDGLMGEAFSTGKPVLVDDITVDRRATARHMLEPTGTRSFLCVPLRWGSNTTGVLLTTHREVGIFTPHDSDLLCTFADYAAIALSNARFYASLQQREEERAYLLRKLMSGQEAERRRVAVDIHDGPLQSIGVNILAIDRIRKLMDIGRSSDALAELVQVREGMSAVVQELRDVINDLRPVVLENLGLVAATGAYLKHFREHSDIHVHLEDKLDGQRLPASKEVVFFRLLQEALTNVRKHASAGSVWVTFDVAGGVFRMSVTDNGLGFDPKSMARSRDSGHIGLHSMQERIEAIGGGMEIESTEGQGTRLTFRANL